MIGICIVSWITDENGTSTALVALLRKPWKDNIWNCLSIFYIGTWTTRKGWEVASGSSHFKSLRFIYVKWCFNEKGFVPIYCRHNKVKLEVQNLPPASRWLWELQWMELEHPVHIISRHFPMHWKLKYYVADITHQKGWETVFESIWKLATIFRGPMETAVKNWGNYPGQVISRFPSQLFATWGEHLFILLTIPVAHSACNI